MDELIRKIPKSLLAAAILIVGFAFIILSNPPRTVCDEQLDLFMQSQKQFLAKEGKLSRSIFAQLFSMCKSENTPGGCFDLFQNLKRMAEDLEAIPRSCSATLAERNEVKGPLLMAMTLMAQIAWGEQIPKSGRFGWLDSADVRLFCRLSTIATKALEEEQFTEFRESVIGALPGAAGLPVGQRFKLSLFGVNCRY